MTQPCPTCQDSYRADRYEEQRWRHLCSCELKARPRCGRCRDTATHVLLCADGSFDRPSCYDHGVPEEEVGAITFPEVLAKTKAPPASKVHTPPATRSVPRFESLAIFEVEVRKNSYPVLCKHCHDEHPHGTRICIVDDYGAFDTRCPKCRKAGFYTALAVTTPGVTQGRPPEVERCMFCGATHKDQPR